MDQKIKHAMMLSKCPILKIEFERIGNVIEEFEFALDIDKIYSFCDC